MTGGFYRPESIDETCRLVAEHPEARVVAGGQSLSPLLQINAIDPDAFIDISGLDDLAYVEREGDTLRIGAGTTWARLADSAILGEHVPPVRELSGQIGDVQVRNRGTIGGSLSHADPAADMGALLLCYETEMVCRSVDGRRTVPLEEFFRGMYETALAEDELLVETRVSIPEDRWGGHYEKYERRKGGFSLVGVGASVRLDGLDRVEHLAVGLANCGDTPLTVEAAADRAIGLPVDDDLRETIETTVAEVADPIGDANASRGYRKRVAGKLAAKAVDRAVEAVN